MAGFAKIAVMGFLGADPETKYTPNGAMVVSLRIAVNARRRGNQQQSGGEEPPPTWYRISAWDRLAERIDRMAQQGYIVKGRPLFVEGSFEPREFTGSDGVARISYDVTMTDFQFVGGNDRTQEGQGGGNYSGGASRGGSSNSGSGSPSGGSSAGNSRGGYDDSSANRRSSTFNDDDAPNNMDDVPF